MNVLNFFSGGGGGTAVGKIKLNILAGRKLKHVEKIILSCSTKT